MSLRQCIGRPSCFTLFVLPFVFAFVCLHISVLFIIIIILFFNFFVKPHAFCHFAVSLGFTKEVPATSCREIKASEGASAVSGNYWLDSIKPGQVTLVACDMRTRGEFL